MLDRSTALPSANREYGVLPAPFNCSSYRVFVWGLVLSKRLIARCQSRLSVLGSGYHILLSASNILHLPIVPPMNHFISQLWIPGIIKKAYVLVDLQLPSCIQSHVRYSIKFVHAFPWRGTHLHNIVPTDICRHSPLSTQIHCQKLTPGIPASSLLQP